MTSAQRQTVIDNIDVLLKCETKWSRFEWMADPDIEAARVMLQMLRDKVANDDDLEDEVKVADHQWPIGWEASVFVGEYDEKVCFADIHVRKVYKAGRQFLMRKDGGMV